MKITTKSIISVFTLACLSVQMHAQAVENTYVWHNQNHAAWKIEPQSPFGYVIAGNKYFSSGNTSIYMTGFDEWGSQQWTREHASGFTSLQSFWKSFVKTTDGSVAYFVVSAGESGGHKAYALALNGYGMKFWDQASALPMGIEFGGVCNATNGGYIATGSTNSGQLAVVKFDIYGVLQWAVQIPVSAYGWTIAPAVGGGYVLAGTLKVVKIDNSGNLEWTTTLSLPTSPSGAYTYTEFEEITPLPDYTGFLVTGSCFSNSHSGVYTARVSYSGSVSWVKINDEVNTSGAGTPVCWINNAVMNGSNECVTSWRRGPVSAGGTMYYQRRDLSGNPIGGVTSLGNTIAVREAFMTKAHQKFVIGGTRGNLTSAYSYVNNSLPFSGGGDDRSVESLEVPDPLARLQTNALNAKPIFEYPGSRVFMSELQVFPNPSGGKINVGGALEPGALLRIVNPLGTVVLEQRIREDDTMLQFDLDKQVKGLYTVVVLGDSGMNTRKILVQ